MREDVFKKPIEKREYLSAQEAASIARVTRSDIYAALNTGKLKGYRPPAASNPDARAGWRIDKDDLERWLHYEESLENGWILLTGVMLNARLWTQEIWEEGMRYLKWRERHVLTQRYGLDGGGRRTLAEIADQLDISRERVRQLQRTGEAELRQYVDWQKSRAGYG